MPDTNESRSSIIQSVKTRLGFFTLVILIIESLLGLMVYKSEGLDKTYLILGMLATLEIVVLLVGLSLFKDLSRIIVVALVSLLLAMITTIPINKWLVKAQVPVVSDYDLYLTSPMTSVGEQRYKEIHQVAMHLITMLRSESKFKVYYPGEGLDEKTQFNIPSVYWSENVRNIRKSKGFILIYPEKVATSALIELGFAIALEKTIHIFVPQKNILPYLLRDPPTNVHIIEYGRDFSDFIKVIDKDGRKIFQ